MPVPRWILAAGGLASGGVAVAGALTESPVIGHCLQSASTGFGHCAWCYLGVALLVTAAVPWPRLKPARVRG